jgi:hypothetical protein
VEAQAAVAYGVDGTVDVMELAPPHASRDRVLTDPHRMQLRDGYYSVLPGGDFRHRQIEPVAFFPHVGE